jgi:hypothetical protein
MDGANLFEELSNLTYCAKAQDFIELIQACAQFHPYIPSIPTDIRSTYLAKAQK